MAPLPTVYQTELTGRRDEVTVKQIWQQSNAGPLASGYGQLLTFTLSGSRYLLAVDAGANRGHLFQVSLEQEIIDPIGSPLDLGQPWDAIEPFVLGNVPHLLMYAKRPGQFSFAPINSDLTLGPRYDYYRGHNPGATQGFDVTQPVVVNSSLYFLCYSFDSGTVNIYSLAVAPTGIGRAAPLVANPVWLHTWAEKWTRFAFFYLGGEAYFLKTNVGKLNVNIDHVLDQPSLGTIEVGTNLQLDGALDLSIVRSFYLPPADPYFVAYKADGDTTVYRFHADCQGWTKVAAFGAVPNATNLVPIQFDDSCALLFY